MEPTLLLHLAVVLAADEVEILTKMQNEQRSDMRRMENRMENKMESMENRMRGDMRTQQGEMQSMGLSLQASMKEVESIMAAPRGGTTEPRRSVECVRPAMETGEVGMTSDATIIDGETETHKHEGTTETFSETREIEEIEVNEIWEIKGHAHIGLIGDNGVELVECFVTWCEHQVNLPQEQRETVCSLEVDCDQSGRAVRGRPGGWCE